LSQSSFTSQSDLRLHFGLGASAETGDIKVVWPSGKTQMFPSQKANREITLVEE
jgi:hypothetical protein